MEAFLQEGDYVPLERQGARGRAVALDRHTLAVAEEPVRRWVKERVVGGGRSDQGI